MTKHFLNLILLALIAMLFQPSAQAQSGPALSELERFSLDLDTLQASFDQTVVNNDGIVESESAGEVWLQRPGLFRWEYHGDFPEVVVADGVTIWLYDEMLAQVTIKSQSSLSAGSPLTLLTDLGRLDEQFEVQELGDDSGMQLLALQARNPEAEFERVLLGLQNGTLLMMAMEDAFGLRTEIRFRKIQRNPDLDPALFQFEPPEGADVIGEMPGGAGDP